MTAALPAGSDLVIVLPHLGPGGAQKVALMAAEHFLVQGRQVTLVTLLPDKPFTHAVPEGLRWVDLGPAVAETSSNRAPIARIWRFSCTWGRRSLAWISLVIGWKVLKRLVPGQAPLLVQWLVSSASGVQATLLRDLLYAGKPARVLSLLTRTNLLCCQAMWALPGHLVVSERNDPRLQKQSFPWLRLRSWLWQRADVITANTIGVLEGLQHCHPAMADDMRLLPNPLVVDSHLGNHSDGPASGPCFLAVCRLVPQKGIDLLIQAYAQLPEPLREMWPLLIAGDGPERASLETLASSLLPRAQVRFMGFQRNPQVLYHRDAVFVLSSRFEGMPNSLLEAMGSGLAVIVSDASPGPLEVVVHGKSGWVVPTEQVTLLAEAMQAMAENPALRRRLGDAAAEFMDAYSWDALDPIWSEILCFEKPG